MKNKRSKEALIAKLSRDRFYYFMFLPVFLGTLILKYWPMLGIRFAFYNFTPFKKQFIGLDNFKDLFFGVTSSRFWAAFNNTLYLSLTNLFLATVFTVLVALLLNELVSSKIKGFVQTALYLPHFISWVVVASIFTIVLSPQGGLVNIILQKLGMQPIHFLVSEKWWPPIYLIVSRWKETGWGTIIYLAALAGIAPELYEAASIDGAGRLRQVISITIPSLMQTILVVFILNLAKVMNIFESVFALYNPNVYDVADVVATFAYRTGILQAKYGLGTAIGLFRSLIGLVLVLLTDEICKKIRGDGIM